MVVATCSLWLVLGETTVSRQVQEGEINVKIKMSDVRSVGLPPRERGEINRNVPKKRKGQTLSIMFQSFFKSFYVKIDFIPHFCKSTVWRCFSSLVPELGFPLLLSSLEGNPPSLGDGSLLCTVYCVLVHL